MDSNKKTHLWKIKYYIKTIVIYPANFLLKIYFSLILLLYYNILLYNIIIIYYNYLYLIAIRLTIFPFKFQISFSHFHVFYNGLQFWIEIRPRVSKNPLTYVSLVTQRNECIRARNFQYTDKQPLDRKFKDAGQHGRKSIQINSRHHFHRRSAAIGLKFPRVSLSSAL